jgi:hypothetical protein
MNTHTLMRDCMGRATPCEAECEPLEQDRGVRSGPGKQRVGEVRLLRGF